MCLNKVYYKSTHHYPHSVIIEFFTTPLVYSLYSFNIVLEMEQAESHNLL